VKLPAGPDRLAGNENQQRASASPGAGAADLAGDDLRGALRHAALSAGLAADPRQHSFAMVGGMISLAMSGQYLSVPASVGFIALLGIAVLNGSSW
jgi:cobalt-zinc-cadmium resistance protein CzcA